jgi:hypothetical protein
MVSVPKIIYTLLPLVVFVLGLPATEGGNADVLVKRSQGFPSAIKDPAALEELEANITAYTVPANYGSASFNQVNPLYPGAVGLYVYPFFLYGLIGRVLKMHDIESETKGPSSLTSALDTR